MTHDVSQHEIPLSRFTQIRTVLIIILFLNWFVSFLKIVYGFISKSSAISADGFHSFSDGTSNIIALVGVWVASQPVDKEHPYGHKKYETFTAIVIAVVLFIVAFNLIHDGVERFFHPVVPIVTTISFAVMVATLIVNFIVVKFEMKRSRELKSDILMADATHTRSDILVSLSVIVTLIAIRVGFPIVDTIAAIVIALFIAYGGIMIMRESSAILCDRGAMVSDKIRDIVLGIEGIKDCHKIRTRGRSDDIYIDLHILVNPDMHVKTAHELNDVIEKAIKEKIEGVTDISIHTEPYDKHEKFKEE